MPLWAVAAFTAVIAAVLESLTALFVLSEADKHHWTRGFTALASGLAALFVMAVIALVLTSVLRSIDRRTR